jgi:hypothetical protein
MLSTGVVTKWFEEKFGVIDDKWMFLPGDADFEPEVGQRVGFEVFREPTQSDQLGRVINVVKMAKGAK